MAEIDRSRGRERGDAGEPAPARGGMLDRPAVLLVDDVAENLSALEATLRRDDVDLLMAGSGKDALEILLERTVSLAIIDVQMPEMSGFELATIMRSVERTRHVPIMFVTATSQDERRVFDGYEAGAVDFLFKPIDPHVLRSKVDAFVTLEMQRNELRRSAARFQALVQAGSQAVWRLTVDGRALNDSPSYRELTGMTLQQFMSCRWFDAIHPDDQERVARGWADARAASRMYEAECRVRRPDGAYTWTLARVAPVFDEAGNLVEWIGANTDIQARKETETLREMFIAILGHDLRSPLGAVLNGTQLAMRSAGEELRRPLARVLVSGERMRRMIEQLLDVTRVRLDGGIALSLAPVDLTRLVDQVLSEWSVERDRFRLEVEGDVQGTWDADRLSQIISNLLGNAVEHSTRDRPIRIWLDGRATGAVEIGVHNQGPAVPRELQEVLFEPFRGQADCPGRSRRGKGLGLGLFITRQLVLSHGGEISFTTSDDSGTEFRVRLPRHTDS